MSQLDNDNKLRLQVFLSRNGYCSRRKAMTIIQSGKVTVNGRKVIEPSFKVDAKADRIKVAGNNVKNKTFDYIILNKPAGVTSTRKDAHAKKTIYELIPKEYHHCVFAGRLDKNTQGLILLTNDGDLVMKLTHPKYHVDKVYDVTVNGKLSKDIQIRLEKGVVIDSKRTMPCKIRKVKTSKDQTKAQVVLHEGRKRQIRLMFDKFDHQVIYLKRIQQGPLKIGNLAMGQHRKCTTKEIEQLKSL